MGGTCSTREAVRNSYNTSVLKLKGREYVDDPDVDGRTTTYENGS
jgi:hypothetical protein